ncbi:CrcB family protein [Streptomyces sp. CHD11]|uniref:fluoride efflux transporter FluC n=1 Tax=Streptomyces sp. CHD11 TaxID=2741325 RepID=UPI001BFBF860|nr:CrcB family protein [Streptomyces sp. CHD11]MBT3152534.1 CrcB family protein [Streptomyces sp. CHD11]
MTAPETEGPRARHVLRTRAAVVAAVALGGGAGAVARYAASLGWPAPAHGFPWTNLWVNVSGCAAIGVFMVIITGSGAVHPLVRPFFGTGVLGGFTTFSTYAVDLHGLFGEGEAGAGLVYLAVTPLAALAAVWSAASVTRRVLTRRRP